MGGASPGVEETSRRRQRVSLRRAHAVTCETLASREAGQVETTTMGFLRTLLMPLERAACNWYRGEVGRNLTRYGLRYDDLLDPLNSLDIEEALKRLPQKEVEARNARLKRAMDLNFKHAELPPEIQALQDPFKPYLSPYVEQVKAENAERAAVGAGKPYDRQLP